MNFTLDSSQRVTVRDRTPTASVYLTRLSYLWNAMELESGCEKKRLAVLR